jgi:hypothetical protein
MFSATCSYVRKLAPPAEFSDRMNAAIEKMVMLRLKEQIISILLPERKDRFGLERYSDEHWIGSHPDVKPCDCDPTGPCWKFQKKRLHLDNLSFGVAPRPYAEIAPDAHDLHYDKFAVPPSNRIREYVGRFICCFFVDCDRHNCTHNCCLFFLCL